MTMHRLGTFEGLTLEVHRSITAIPPLVWDDLIGDDQPLVSHAHLSALERSGLTLPDHGIQARYILAHSADGEPRAGVPAFLKSNSSGELGVDLGLPMAHERMSGPYYPKLQVEVPFSLIPGPRLLVAGAKDPQVARTALLSGLQVLAETEGAQSIHISYMQDADRHAAEAAGYLIAETTNFLWRNARDDDFESWVAGMHKKARKRVRDEYYAHLDAGIEFRVTKGEALSDTGGDVTFRRYCATYQTHGTDIWLNKRYFNEVSQTMGDQIELHEAYEGEAWLGGFYCWTFGDRLCAVHWLAEEARRNLTFGAIYSTIADATSRGIKTIDFGPLSPHKVYRGVAPEAVPHAMHFLNADFHALADTVLAKRNDVARNDRAELEKRLPFQTSLTKGEIDERQ
ncbi:GNAT family N-acetyltransferase [Rhodobacteraceae bacterium]|nr:GNAT family N-acetyltransferase [Paracoccaceae bacterium]